ncbi:asparagine synthase (glutamine-hydrolyzing) [Actinoplanes sp. NPDC051475]|uniref:asparagine synthase (glutamine-hydrolyzing) n=1 Tax=Actinoplanes sp. NPDC051475 TaxID=3157225 RepID=UPI00344C2C95
MCGLGGVAQLDGADLSPAADRTLANMAMALAHRGPDDEELLRAGPVGLAFTRLSLVDPAGGGQPLYSEDGTVVLIANGEVYNHRELEAGLASGTRMRTGSDCEVLVHLYRQRGVRFLDGVRGMFAIVLYDQRTGRLILARDQFGVKPLYFWRDRTRIAFASEIKALFEEPACPRRLDWQAVLAHPAFSGAPVISEAPTTVWFDGIEEVPPATILEIDLRDGGTRAHRYWQPPEPGTTVGSDDAIVDTFAELLRESVTDCAMADAEVGLFLSGGVDSAAVASLAARTGDLHTFTVLSGGTVRSGDAEHAFRSAHALGLPHHQVVFPADRVPDAAEWKRLLWLTEMPTCGPEQFYKYEMHRYVKAQHPNIKGMLLGAAADEYAGGYSSLYADGGGWDGFIDTLTGMARQRLLQRRPGLSIWFDSPLPLLRDRVLADGASALDDPYAAYVAAKLRDVDQYNCWHEDRTAAGNGIEARVPFLDVRLIELIMGLSVERRKALLWDKWLVREAVRPLLPPMIVDRPKVAFYHGDGFLQTQSVFVRMLLSDGAALVEEALSTPSARELIDADNVMMQLRALHDDPGSGHVEQVMRVVNLGLLDAMTQSMPARPAVAARAALPVALDGRTWLDAPAETARRVLQLADLGPTDVPSLRPGTSLLHDPAVQMWYVAVDGVLEYEIDADSDPSWLAFLRAVDGQRCLDDVLGSIEVSLADVTEQLQSAVEIGLVRFASFPVVQSPGPTGEIVEVARV